MRDAELGLRLVDKLVKVWRNNGQETFVLVHIEVQSQVEEEFAEMLYVTSLERLGKLDNARESVIEVLQTRFETLPPQLRVRVNAIRDISLLKRLHKRAVTVGSIEEFELFLSQGDPEN